MNIEVIAEIVGIFAAIIGGTWVLGRVIKRRAYDDGAHSKAHDNISGDIKEAHDKIRGHDIDIEELKRNSAVNAKEHEVLLKGQAHANSRLDKIYEILVAKK